MASSCSSKGTSDPGWRRRFTTGTWSSSSAAEVGLHPGPQLLGPLGRQPLALAVAGGADLRDQDQVLGVGVQRLVDQLVGHVGPVELGRVDVVDAGLDRPPQDGQGPGPVPGGRTRRGRGVASRRTPCGGPGGRPAALRRQPGRPSSPSPPPALPQPEGPGPGDIAMTAGQGQRSSGRAGPGWRETGGMRVVLNILWLVFGGLIWPSVRTGRIVMFVLIITIPFGVAAFRLAVHPVALRRTVVAKPARGSARSSST